MLTRYLLCGLLAVAGLRALPGAGQALDPTFTPPAGVYTAGYVYSMGPPQADGKRVFSCTATRFGQAALGSTLVRLEADGTLDQAFRQNVGAATGDCQIRQLPSGQYLLHSPLGILKAGNLQRTGLLRLNADGTADASFNANADLTSSGGFAFTSDCAVQADGKVLVGGSFDSFAGQPAHDLVRLNANGSLDASFSVGSGLGGSFNGQVQALAVLADGKVLAGGPFTTFSGQPAHSLVRLNTDGSVDPTFTSALASYDRVSGLLVQPDGRILVSGVLGQGSSATTLVRLLPSGALDPGFALAPELAADVMTDEVLNQLPMQLQPDGRIVVVGQFDLPGRRGVARLLASGALDESFQAPAGPDQLPSTLGLQPGGGVLVGGHFAAGTATVALAQLSSSGSVAAAYAPRFLVPGRVLALARRADNSLLVAGDFTEWNGVPVHQVAHLSATGTPDPSYGTGSLAFSSGVRLLLAQANGGAIAVTELETVVRLLADGSPDAGFVLPAAAQCQPTALAEQADGQLLLLGNVPPPPNSGRPFTGRVVRLTTSGALDQGFAPILAASDGPTAVLVQPDGRIVLATHPLSATGAATLRRFEASGAADASFAAPSFAYASGAWATVGTLTQQADGRLLAAGSFDRVGSVGQALLARLTATGALDASFAPGVALPSGSTVRALAVQPNGRMLVGGDFTLSQGSLTYRNLLRLHGTGALDASFAPTANPSQPVTTLLVQPDGGILLQGSFTTVAGQTCFNLARLTAPNVLRVQAPGAVAAATAAWPVPAHERLLVLPDPAAHPLGAELLDALGRVVRQQALAGPAQFSFDTSTLPAGPYVLRLRYAEGPVSRPVSVE